MRPVSKQNAQVGIRHDATLDQQARIAMMNTLSELLRADAGNVGSYERQTSAICNMALRAAPDALSDFAEHWACRNPLP